MIEDNSMSDMLKEDDENPQQELIGDDGDKTEHNEEDKKDGIEINKEESLTKGVVKHDVLINSDRKPNSKPPKPTVIEKDDINKTKQLWEEREKIKEKLEMFIASHKYLSTLQFEVYFASGNKIVCIRQYKAANVCAKFFNRSNYFINVNVLKIALGKDREMNLFLKMDERLIVEDEN